MGNELLFLMQYILFRLFSNSHSIPFSFWDLHLKAFIQLGNHDWQQNIQHILQTELLFHLLQERIMMVALQCFGPEVIRRLIGKLEDSLRAGHLSTYLRPELKNFLLLQMPAIRYSMTLLHRIHLAIFYFSGAFYHISKRMTGVKYVSLWCVLISSFFFFLIWVQPLEFSWIVEIPK